MHVGNNFLKYTTYGDKINTRVIHKLAQKLCIKGPCYITGNLFKGTILWNELKMDHCANVFDCCITLK